MNILRYFLQILHVSSTIQFNIFIKYTTKCFYRHIYVLKICIIYNIVYLALAVKLKCKTRKYEYLSKITEFPKKKYKAKYPLLIKYYIEGHHYFQYLDKNSDVIFVTNLITAVSKEKYVKQFDLILVQFARF